MKHAVLSIMLASAIFSSPAFANDTMNAMIGRSVVYTYPEGAAVTAHYAADGTYATDSAGGKWTMEGDRLCIETQAGRSGCAILDPERKSGETWSAKDAFGDAVQISIQ